MSESDTRAAIMSHRCRRYGRGEIEGMGTVCVQSLTERERAILDGTPEQRMHATLISIAVVDEDGNRVFADGDVEQLLDVDSNVTRQLIELISDHCSGRMNEVEHIKN